MFLYVKGNGNLYLTKHILVASIVRSICTTIVAFDHYQQKIKKPS